VKDYVLLFFTAIDDFRRTGPQLGLDLIDNRQYQWRYLAEDEYVDLLFARVSSGTIAAGPANTP
jgi:hypothetical protein